MALDLEDEIDWSDGSLEPRCPASEYQACNEIPHEEAIQDAYHQDTFLDPETHEQWDVPFGEPVPLNAPWTRSSSKFGLSRLQRSKIGVHFNRREPTKDDYSNFVLYQANQKTYEAVFLKAFIAHALHPDQLRRCSNTNSQDANIDYERYLRSVTNTVNQVVNKMIWNAHYRAVNLLANDGKERSHFWDFQQFDKHVFSEFSPNHVIPVVDKLNESWHRAFDPPLMVRYGPKDYPIGKHCSPLEEIDEVAGVLFNDRELGKTLATGRAVKLPSTKRGKRRHLPGAALRDEAVPPPNKNWLHQLVTSVTAEGPISHSQLPDSKTRRDSPQDSIDDGVFVNDGQTHDYDFAGLEEIPFGGDGSDVEMADITDTAIANDNDEPSHLELLVRHHGLDVLNEESIPVRSNEENDGYATGSSWRVRLIDDHKERLAERWPQSQQRSLESPPDLGAVINRAIAQGILKPPSLQAQRCINHAVAREQNRKKIAVLRQKLAARNDSTIQPGPQTYAAKPDDGAGDAKKQKGQRSTRKGKPSAAPRKRPKATSKNTNTNSNDTSLVSKVRQRKPAKAESSLQEYKPSLSHPSGSKTLEDHQIMPPDAYFEPTYDEEKPVWRCGIKHAMGHYYNAGDRKNCPGCFTSVNENPKLIWMDFYMPSRSHFFQSAPGVVWKPSKQFVKERRSKTLSHNSIAKEAFWAAFNDGASENEARKKGVEAVEEHLRPKPPPEPIRELTPEPSPEPVDLGPHPSGSKTMEHGQDLPQCAYFEQEEDGEKSAWRCDVNHAFGRYYIAGSKKHCPGCGSNRTGNAPHTEMDFYLPEGAVVRQEASGLVNWKPRRPYKMKRANKKKDKTVLTHNQICTKSYWVAVDAGQGHDDALSFAVKEGEAYLDAKNEEARRKFVESQDTAPTDESHGDDSSSELSSVCFSKAPRTGEGTSKGNLSHQSRKEPNFSLVPKKRGSEELSDGELEEVEVYETGQETSRPTTAAMLMSSDDESTSSSDSE